MIAQSALLRRNCRIGGASTVPAAGAFAAIYRISAAAIRMFLGCVGHHEVPGGVPNNTNQAEQIKRPFPAQFADDNWRYDQREHRTNRYTTGVERHRLSFFMDGNQRVMRLYTEGKVTASPNPIPIRAANSPIMPENAAQGVTTVKNDKSTHQDQALFCAKTIG